MWKFLLTHTVLQGDYSVNSITSKTALILGAALTASAAVAATPSVTTNPYVAGDMHNHNICQDGSVSAARSLDRSVGSGLATNGATNFNLDWFTLGNHGGNGNRDCRFDDTNVGAGAYNAVPSPVQYWSQTLGQAINFDGVYGGPGSVVVSQLKGTPSGTGTGQTMWHWQMAQDIEYPMIVDRTAKYQKVLIEGLEWVTPGHEHTDVAIVKGQTPLAAQKGNADAMAEFEYRFDRADGDVIGPVNAAGNSIWTGKDAINNSGTAGHGKAIAAVSWLQANYPVHSYAIPTHSERQGVFSATGTKGFDINHFRDMNNAAPTVAFGIESPGHAPQGGVSGGSGSYGSGAVGGGTYGMTGIYHAKVGGLWDGMLAEGRNTFMFISSDWHNRGAFGAGDPKTNGDFMPGEYSRLYVKNETGFTSKAVVREMRKGHSYSVMGDLVGNDLVFHAKTPSTDWVGMGETLVAKPGEKITVEMTVTVPKHNNSPYTFANPLLAQVALSQPLNAPDLDHVDLISSPITGVVAPTDPHYGTDANGVAPVGGVAGAALVYNPNTAVTQVPVTSMKKTALANGAYRVTFTRTYTMGSQPMYVRARGTNIPNGTPNVSDVSGNPLLDVNNAKVACTDAACPAHLGVVAGQKVVTYDVQAWSNLWFYTNPIFVRPVGSSALLVEKNAALAVSLGGDL
jgi:hypothetical protein